MIVQNDEEISLMCFVFLIRKFGVKGGILIFNDFVVFLKDGIQ